MIFSVRIQDFLNWEGGGWGEGVTTNYKHVILSYNDMELTFVIPVKDIWQFSKVCDQGRSVGKIKFTRNRIKKMVGNPPLDYCHSI